MEILEYQGITKSQINEAKEFLQSIGEDPKEYTNAQLRHMIEQGF